MWFLLIFFLLLQSGNVFAQTPDTDNIRLKFLFVNVNQAKYFDRIVDETINSRFAAVTPFKENINLMDFYTAEIEDPEAAAHCSSGIEGSSGYFCQPDWVISKLSDQYMDYDVNEYITIVVIESPYAGGAGLTVTATSNPNLSEDDAARVSSTTIVHEVGHIFGLLDYAIGMQRYDGNPNFFWNPDSMVKFYNIDRAGCSKWCQNFIPVNQYDNSPSAQCPDFPDKTGCLSYERSSAGECLSDNCCIWSETPFDYFNSRCVPYNGDVNIGLSCIEGTGCYFGSSYSHYVWKPLPNGTETIMSDGYGVLDPVSVRQVESVFRCCLDSSYSSPLTEGINCSEYKNNFDNFLSNYGLYKKFGNCMAGYLNPTSTVNPTDGLHPGDANGDGNVDGVDYMIWFNHYKEQVTGAINGDFNSDNVVDGVDYMIWFTHYMQ